MARLRTSYNPLLKSYPDSEKINAVSEGAEVLYVRLLAASDDKGRYYGDPQWVLARLFTARMIAEQITRENIASRLEELQRVGLILCYSVGGAAYLEMIDVMKALRADVKADIRFPDPEEAAESGTGRIRDESGPRPSRNGYANPTQPNPTKTQPEEENGHGPDSKRGPLRSLTEDILRDDAKLQRHFQYLVNLKRFNLADTEADRLLVFGMAESALEATKGGGKAAAYFNTILRAPDRSISNEFDERGRRRLAAYDLKRRKATSGDAKSIVATLASGMRPADLPEVDE